MRKPNLFPSDAEDIYEDACSEILDLGYPCNAPEGVHATGVLLSQWFGERGLRCDFTPPKHLVRGLYQSSFPEGGYLMYSDDLVYFLNIRDRNAACSAMSGELLKRRRYRLFRLWRRAQRMAVYFWQRLSG